MGTDGHGWTRMKAAVTAGGAFLMGTIPFYESLKIGRMDFELKDARAQRKDRRLFFGLRL